MTLSFSSPEIAERVREWTSEEYDKETRAEIQALVDAGDVKELEERFYRSLEFGTGGLRGLLGAGTNRMNRTVVARATQGLANYLKQHAEKPAPLRAAITHDSRNFSREFAETAAGVLAANDIVVHISPELRPTPYLSFAVRHLDCHIGIVVTASHNPKEYNGYKVYWHDGSQVVPPHDKGIVAEVKKISSNDQVKQLRFDEAVARGLVHIMDETMDKAYLNAVAKQCIDAEAIRANPLKIVYTPLHGVGGTLAPTALRQWGFNDVYPEEAQMKPDGNFPTAASPNPEEGKALERAIALAREVGGELVLATDPDADRLGIAVLHRGVYQLMTGNQLGAVICDYILARRKELGTLPAKPAVCTTIVTTPLFPEVAAYHDAICPLVLTGFKWIAKASRDLAAKDPEIAFLYGTEESYGFLIGDHAMDKDGIVASCITAEVAAWCKGRGKTLVDYLEDLYLRHEPRVEWQKSVTMPGKEGGEKIRAIMKVLQDEPPTEIAGLKVLRRTRVDKGEVYDGQTGKVIDTLDLPKENVVIFDLEDGSRAIGRPSGTEPKIKFYFFLAGNKMDTIDGVRASLKELEQRRPVFESAFLESIGVR
ncbi:MAG: phosphoglucomutase [Candidatus Sumerlaeota bacterium]|nr:phosphoglucomutase [Candidatus Sumerlaeota bacterium]